MSANVSITACPDYERDTVAAALEAVLAPLGGLDWVEEGMRIAIKTNLVGKGKPEEAVVTHPVLLTELCRMLTARGASVTVGDSPGGPYTNAYVSAVYSGCGLRAVEETGAVLNRDFSTRDADFPEGVSLKSFPYTAWLDKADVIIDFAKLKTHGLTGMTCAVKNFYGVIPGTRKSEHHYLHADPEQFCHMLIDLNLYVKPRLALVDAVLCMEGNGPTQGDPRHMGALVAADTTFNADLVCAKLIGFSPMDVPTVRLAFERGLAPDAIEKLTVAGDPDAFALSDFKRLPMRETARKGGSPVVSKFMEKNFSPRPLVSPEKCIGCGRCAEVCPVSTIDIKNKKAEIRRRACIRCFCCQEFCPVGAISVQRPPLARLLGR